MKLFKSDPEACGPDFIVVSYVASLLPEEDQDIAKSFKPREKIEPEQPEWGNAGADELAALEHTRAAMNRRDAYWNNRIGFEPEPEKIVQPKEPVARPSLAKELSISPSKYEKTAKVATRPLTFVESAKLEEEARAHAAASTAAASSTVTTSSIMTVPSTVATSSTVASAIPVRSKPHLSPYCFEPHASSEESLGIRGRSHISLDSTSAASYTTRTNSFGDSLPCEQHSRAPIHTIINSVKAINPTSSGPFIWTNHSLDSRPRPAPYPFQSVKLVQPKTSVNGSAATRTASVKPAVGTKLQVPVDKPLPRVPRPVTRVAPPSQRPSPARSCLKTVTSASVSTPVQIAKPTINSTPTIVSHLPQQSTTKVSAYSIS
ncbi:hypothetical protein M422DRAFT_67783 [Sphaerobolus stellatus SS14]|uniref:Uncharacterized protein n=1 Tax=Sphaerobolus stellatus (strain SS14) TaxID=990650 RepID=A0A0C9ULB4_SPHS4|nr:hypothetical protein M422DRAFT_67783 [Sphaerobolus stellatus SS14]